MTDIFNPGRRSLLRAGATAAVGGLLLNSQSAQAQASGAQIKAVPPLAGKVGMRLATCTLGPDAVPTLVLVLDDGRILDVKAAARQQQVELTFDGSSMLALIKSGNAGYAQLQAVAARAIAGGGAFLTLAQAQFLSPIPRPDRNIYCVGWNYLDHFEEGKKARQDTVVEKLPDHPVFFTKGTHTMNGPFDSTQRNGTGATSCVR